MHTQCMFACKDEDKIEAFAMDGDTRPAHAAGRGAGRGRAVGDGAQPMTGACCMSGIAPSPQSRVTGSTPIAAG